MGQDKPERGDSVFQRMGGEGAVQRASDDEDVEGHAQQRGVERAQQRGVERAQQRATPGDEDVEGHKFMERAQQRATPGDDEDVEGHAQQRGVERAQQRATPGDDDDVEGHKAQR